MSSAVHPERSNEAHFACICRMQQFEEALSQLRAAGDAWMVGEELPVHGVGYALVCLKYREKKRRQRDAASVVSPTLGGICMYNVY